jgi:hypothetical protein
VTEVLAEEERLSFALRAGQPLYDVFSNKTQMVPSTGKPLKVYIDPARQRTINPHELLAMGTPTMETFYIRLDFMGRPDFDTMTYNRLRLEHVLTCMSQSCPQCFKRLALLYRFRYNCRILLRNREWTPSPELTCDFLEFFPL